MKLNLENLPELMWNLNIPASQNQQPSSAWTRTTPDCLKWTALCSNVRGGTSCPLPPAAKSRHVNVHCIVSSDSSNTRWFGFSCVAPVRKQGPHSFGFHQRTDNSENESIFLHLQIKFHASTKTQITSACCKMQNNRLCQQMTIKKTT